MTVRELIGQLYCVNLDSEVLVFDNDSNTKFLFDGVETCMEHSKVVYLKFKGDAEIIFDKNE